MGDKKPGRKPTLTEDEETKFEGYAKKCAVFGCGLSHVAADLKLKRILEARGAKWETIDGLYPSFSHPFP
jgi:hypothetical protein